MLDWHPYDSTCDCEPCKVRTLSLQERPDRATADATADAPVVADPIGEIIARCPPPLPPMPLAEMLHARARNEVKLYPAATAASLAEYQRLVIEAVGETPASRAADDMDHCRWLRQQLSVIATLRAQLVVARDLARQYRRDLEVVLADLRSGGAGGWGLPNYDPTELYIVNALREPTVDDALAGLRVDAALARAGEAVPRG